MMRLLLALTATTACAAYRMITLPTRRATVLALATEEIIAAEEAVVAEEVMPVAETPFTLEARQDGWDDVRGGIKEFIRDREKAVTSLKEYMQVRDEKYIQPASRVAKYIAKDLKLDEKLSSGAAPGLPSLPKLDAPLDLTQGVKGVGLQILDAAAAKKQAERQRAAAQAEQKVRSRRVAKQVKAPSTTDVAIANVNLGLLVAVPAATLAFVSYSLFVGL